jgi:hypothetical protein
MQKLLNIPRYWLPLAFVTGALCVLVYLAVQQALRHMANDPQIQMAEDAAYALSQGGSVAEVIPAGSVEINRSLAPFLVVYDETGKPQAGSGVLHGEMPLLPAGVLDYVRRQGEDRISWQPENGVGVAAVVTRFTGPAPGFVLAGRSLREVERREAEVQQIVLLAILAIWLGSLIVVAICELVFNRESSQHGADRV